MITIHSSSLHRLTKEQEKIWIDLIHSFQSSRDKFIAEGTSERNFYWTLQALQKIMIETVKVLHVILDSQRLQKIYPQLASVLPIVDTLHDSLIQLISSANHSPRCLFSLLIIIRIGILERDFNDFYVADRCRRLREILNASRLDIELKIS